MDKTTNAHRILQNVWQRASYSLGLWFRSGPGN